MSDAKWLLRGQAGEQKAAEIKARQQAGYGPNRFYLAKNASAEIVFLDNDGAFFWEHQVQVDGSWRNWFTCLKDFTDCPICSRTDNKRYYGAAYTIINLTGYTKKDGTHVAGQKEILMVKSSQFEKLALKRKNAGGNLAGCMFSFTRVGAQKEPGIGSEWDFIKKVDRATLERYKPADVTMEEWLKPYDYAKLFSPKKAEEICQMIGLSVTPSGLGALADGKPMSRGNSLAEMDQMPGEMPPGVEGLNESSIDDLL